MQQQHRKAEQAANEADNKRETGVVIYLQAKEEQSVFLLPDRQSANPKKLAK